MKHMYGAKAWHSGRRYSYASPGCCLNPDISKCVILELSELSISVRVVRFLLVGVVVVDGWAAEKER